MNRPFQIAAQAKNLSRARVYCPICTHTVEAEVVPAGRRAIVKPGQKCAHCSASIDAGYIMWVARAA